MMKLTQAFVAITMMMAATTMSVDAATCTQPSIPGARCPTYDDYLRVEEIIYEWIERSTCPNRADPALLTHWDYVQTPMIVRTFHVLEIHVHSVVV